MIQHPEFAVFCDGIYLTSHYDAQSAEEQALDLIRTKKAKHAAVFESISEYATKNSLQ